MNKITITVEGECCTGKSTISQEIAEHLEAAGFPVELSFIHNEHPRRTEDKHRAAKNRVLGCTEIAINEKNINRIPRG